MQKMQYDFIINVIHIANYISEYLRCVSDRMTKWVLPKYSYILCIIHNL